MCTHLNYSVHSPDRCSILISAYCNCFLFRNCCLFFITARDTLEKLTQIHDSMPEPDTLVFSVQDIRTQKILSELQKSIFLQNFEKIYKVTLDSINILGSEHAAINLYFNPKFPKYFLFNILSIYPFVSGLLIQNVSIKCDDKNSL